MIFLNKFLNEDSIPAPHLRDQSETIIVDKKIFKNKELLRAQLFFWFNFVRLNRQFLSSFLADLS